jgi:protease-4
MLTFTVIFSYFTNFTIVTIIVKSLVHLKLTLAILEMSKKGCLIAAVVAAILIIIILMCAGFCALLSASTSQMDLSSSEEMFQTETLRKGGEDKIVVIPVEGIIMEVEESSSLFGTAYASSIQINQYLDAAMGDSNVKAVILVIDSPGGDVYASDQIYNKILEVQDSGIKVVTLMKGVAASGGYYIAAPSDQIVASPITITGSIGAYMQFQSLEGLYEKIGVENRIITNSEGEYKTGEGLFDDDPEGEEDRLYQEMVDEMFDKFIGIVADGRNLTITEIRKFADGRVFTGTKALEYDLVDTLGDFDVAISVAETEAGVSDATIIEYSQYDFWSLLAGYMTNVTNPMAVLESSINLRPGPRLMMLYVEEE